MHHKTLLTLLAGMIAITGSLRAQEEAVPAEGATPETPKAGESPGPDRFWQAKLGEGGHFMVPLDRIVSVSRQQYLLDGAVIVDEVTVDTTGQALARFYFLKPVSSAVPGNTVAGLASRGRDLLDKVARDKGVEVQDMVVKKYPETSHAKSLEFRLLAEADLTALYNSVRNAWETGRGRQFSAK